MRGSAECYTIRYDVWNRDSPTFAEIVALGDD
jgi:hypothetical protein